MTRKALWAGLGLAAVLLAAVLVFWVGYQPYLDITRVSVDSSGREGNGRSAGPSISADGRFIAFMSRATNLVSGDTNGEIDIFVHDRRSGATERVSISTSGDQGNGHNAGTSISANGRFVAFTSDATNLIPGDTNGQSDIFVHDRDTGETQRVNLSSAGDEANGYSFQTAISADGRFVAFCSEATNLVPGDTNALTDRFVHDRETGETVIRSRSGSDADLIRLGMFRTSETIVCWCSTATDLVPNDTNGLADIFIRDHETGRTARVNVSASGNGANGEVGAYSMSADNRFIAFMSAASNLVPGDTNGQWDIFVVRNPLAP